MAESPGGGTEVEYVGPLGHYDVVLNGWRVPFLEAHMQRGGMVLLIIDGRTGLEISVADAERIVPFVADAIAIASGYACHPREPSTEPVILSPTRPRRAIGLDWVERDERATG